VLVLPTSLAKELPTAKAKATSGKLCSSSSSSSCSCSKGSHGISRSNVPSPNCTPPRGVGSAFRAMRCGAFYPGLKPTAKALGCSVLPFHGRRFALLRCPRAHTPRQRETIALGSLSRYATVPIRLSGNFLRQTDETANEYVTIEPFKSALMQSLSSCISGYTFATERGLIPAG
jgi:hypothetical protein